MTNLFTKDDQSAFDAKNLAQWIAFGPVLFQVARVLRDSGILTEIERAGPGGLDIESICEAVQVPHYGARVLLEAGLGMKLIVWDGESKYRITRTGYFICHDPLTRVNMDFVHDVCYKGLFSLDKSIANGRPEGLPEFGNWRTIYEGLSALPRQVQKSWFAFDHFFSDIAFPKVLPVVYRNTGVKKVLDIGGNTGKWAVASTGYDPGVQVTIMDLPGQLDVARGKIETAGLGSRVKLHPANLLDPAVAFPRGHDVIWMSQFLDCFSEDEIVSILERCRAALDGDEYILILEAFWDCQRFETAAFCLQQTSVYFTALANGNSQMYHSDVFIGCIRKAGLEVTERTDGIGLSHTLLKCKPIKS